jgi:hypothetical protein
MGRSLGLWPKPGEIAKNSSDLKLGEEKEKERELRARENLPQ